MSEYQKDAVANVVSYLQHRFHVSPIALCSAVLEAVFTVVFDVDFESADHSVVLQQAILSLEWSTALDCLTVLQLSLLTQFVALHTPCRRSIACIGFDAFSGEALLLTIGLEVLRKRRELSTSLEDRAFSETVSTVEFCEGLFDRKR